MTGRLLKYPNILRDRYTFGVRPPVLIEDPTPHKPLDETSSIGVRLIASICSLFTILADFGMDRRLSG